MPTKRQDRRSTTHAVQQRQQEQVQRLAAEKPQLPSWRQQQHQQDADLSGLSPRIAREGTATPPGRAVTRDFAALRLYEAVLRRDGDKALQESVARACARMARFLLDEAGR